MRAWLERAGPRSVAMFPVITDNAQARECARTTAWRAAHHAGATVPLRDSGNARRSGLASRVGCGHRA